MNNITRHICLPLLALLVGVTAAQEKSVGAQKEEAKPPEPLFEKTHATLDAKGNLVLEYQVNVPVTIERQVKDGDTIRTVLATTTVVETRARTIAQPAFRAVDAAGQPIADDVLAKKLSKRRQVFIWRQKNPPMADQLKSLDKESLVLFLIKPKAEQPR